MQLQTSPSAMTAFVHSLLISTYFVNRHKNRVRVIFKRVQNSSTSNVHVYMRASLRSARTLNTTRPRWQRRYASDKHHHHHHVARDVARILLCGGRGLSQRGAKDAKVVEDA